MCGSERTETNNTNGICQMPLLPHVARAALHFWEEPVLSGTKGSGTVFFSGCSLKCIYCQNSEISHERFGKEISAKRLAEIFYGLEKAGAHNINLVSPTHYSLAIMEALDIYRPKIPVVYNSSGYENVDTLKMLEKYIDIYLMDFKYFSPQRASLYSKAQDYPEVAKNAIKEAYRQHNNCIFDDDGIMKSGVIVRHLILPQGTNDAISVFDWTRENAKNSCFSLMAQYVPCGEAKNDKLINRRITKREYEKVANYICQSDIENCFVQELESASESFIPDFDLTGI